MDLTADDIVTRIRSGRLEGRSVTETAMVAADRVGRDLRAFVETRGQAIDEAAAVDASEAARRLPLAGVPVGVKDMFADRDRTPTCGSNVGAHWTRGTAAVIQRLRAAGAVVLGYTNLHEWGIGTTSAVTATGPIRNPWDRARIAGGSSGGSAAAVAAGIVPLATGTDAGASIRVPAACCGIVGFKPTWGMVPLDGFAEGTEGPPVDHAGPLARSVRDARTAFEVMAATKVGVPDLRDTKVGVAREFFFDGAAPDVAAAVSSCVDLLRARVATVKEIALQGVHVAQQALPLLLLAYTAHLLRDDLATRPEAFQPESLNLLMLGAQMAQQDVAQADALRVELRSAWDRLFEEVDVVITPTIPVPPPLIGQDTLSLPAGEWSTELAFVAYNAPMNLGGVPALSVPCAEVDGWTVNMTITAARGRDDLVLAVGEAVEKVTGERYRNRVAPT